MKPGVSVVICCHNSAKRLPETLRNLAAQEISPDLPWEVIVVDNASTDDTATVARNSWAATSSPLRVVAEPKAGLCHARIRGIQEAQHEIISFLDDDNWAAPDWIRRVQAIFSSRPEVGACGGRINAVCEISPPSWFESLRGNYAVGPQHSETGDITNDPGTLLFGAGLNLRTAAIRELFDKGFVFLMSGRDGNRLLAGEDTELCFALRALGWHLWYDDALQLRHFIPKERLRWDYARRLMQGMGKASILFELYLLALDRPPFQARPPWKRTWLFQLLKILWQWLALVLFHPWACAFAPEGSSAALKFEAAKGRWIMLWNLLGRYQKLLQQIARADWVRGGAERQGSPAQSGAKAEF